ncbi:MAG: hypothetical protein ACK5PP_19550 [Acidimicrobiales bacterium]
MFRRPARLLVTLAAALGLLAAGCGDDNASADFCDHAAASEEELNNLDPTAYQDDPAALLDVMINVYSGFDFPEEQQANADLVLGTLEETKADVEADPDNAQAALTTMFTDTEVSTAADELSTYIVETCDLDEEAE